MKRLIAGLNLASGTDDERIPDGLYLVRVHRAQYRRHATKPFYALRFGVLAPKNYVGCAITARLYCTPKALWKLNWFLRDFGYDPELLGRDEVEEKSLAGLTGAVKISHTVVNGASQLNLDGFAPASQWTDDGTGDLAEPRVAS